MSEVEDRLVWWDYIARRWLASGVLSARLHPERVAELREIGVESPPPQSFEATIFATDRIGFYSGVNIIEDVAMPREEVELIYRENPDLPLRFPLLARER